MRFLRTYAMSTDQATLCETCKEVLKPKREDLEDELILSSTTYSIQDGVDAGCKLCVAFATEMLPTEKEFIKKQLQVNPSLPEAERYVTEFSFRRREAKGCLILGIKFHLPVETPTWESVDKIIRRGILLVSAGKVKNITSHQILILTLPRQ
jgi:hypothetical protein